MKITDIQVGDYFGFKTNENTLYKVVGVRRTHIEYIDYWGDLADTHIDKIGFIIKKENIIKVKES